MYGGNILNTGDPSLFNVDDFVNGYQNKDMVNKKMFVILWLHAQKYDYKSLSVKTALPEWATKEFKFTGEKVEPVNLP